MRTAIVALLVAGALGPPARAADPAPARLAPQVRGLVVRAGGPVVVDGKLDEWAGAFCTPVHYNHRFLTERAAQFFYLWDDQALYFGVRTLDTKVNDPGGPRAIFDGDSVELYFDLRPAPALRGKDWAGPAAVHLHASGFDGPRVAPRFMLVRGGDPQTATRLDGVEIAATLDGATTTAEYKFPWRNFPDFAPKPGAILALDAELCSGDGDRRVDRTFAYGSPLSVQQPASQAVVALVERVEPGFFPQVGPAAFPMWVDTPWVQPERARVFATVAIPPELVDRAAAVEVRLHDADGAIVRTIPAPVEPFGPPAGRFRRAVASWSIDDFAPNTYFATARVTDRDGRALATVAPRMVAEANMTGR